MDKKLNDIGATTPHCLLIRYPELLPDPFGQHEVPQKCAFLN